MAFGTSKLLLELVRLTGRSINYQNVAAQVAKEEFGSFIFGYPRQQANSWASPPGESIWQSQ
jgi:hypothetical protein